MNVVEEKHHPAYVVWELTLRCDHACLHCGSRAVRPRPGELDTAEALAVVTTLAEMGASEVVLIGGEAYLHPGFLEIVRAIAAAGMVPVMTTGGYGITPALAADIARAGMQRVSVSVDGDEAAHDRIRAKPGSHAHALQALENLRVAGLPICANTNVNRFNVGTLDAIYEALVSAGAQSWQVQLTVPLGRGADHAEMILQPEDLLSLMPRLAELKRRGRSDGLLLMLGNNLGYFGPDEGLLRSASSDASDHFRGCQAGRFVLGIESNGNFKGCPSLQPAYIRGNLRRESLPETWSSGALEVQSDGELWGFCKTCGFASVCAGGCSFTAHALFGRRGNNPYCYHRAHDFAQRGLRERLTLKTPAAGQPFDHGIFELTIERRG